MPSANYGSPATTLAYLKSPSVSDNEMLNNVLNISAKLSAIPQSNSIEIAEKMIPLNRNSENTSVMSAHDNGTPMKSSDELRKEIATLESEILHLERYLLSLYRTAFDQQHLPATSDHLHSEKGSASQVVENQSHHNLKPHLESSPANQDHTSPAHGWAATTDEQSCTASLHSTSTMDEKSGDSGRRSLAEHLGASCLLDSFNTPDRLSEDILKCISSIYCRLANPPHSQGAVISSPPSSFSSSSIFSSRNTCDNWSPQYREDALVHHQGMKDEVSPYASMVEVLKICLDDDSFNYAAVMLKNFRSLVRSLEKVDPKKMKREEKLAFWINIHNALIMHAYLAYGTRNRVKGASISKATYNVGGHCITACTIQSSIFGIRSHYSESWLQMLFSPGRTSKTGSIKHAYALEYPEPLVHFALCTGAYLDPAVRVYTAKNIFRELKRAKEEFIRAHVYIDKDTKILLPKILSYYAKDMGMDMEAISGCLTEAQQRCMRKHANRKLDKYVHWLPQSSSFRYLIHAELAKDR